MSDPTCDSHGHECKCKSQIASQTLEELDFERGIWSAAQYGDVSKVKKRVETGKYEVDQRDSAGYTALHYAARNGHLDVCEYLVIKGAQIDAATKSGKATALHRACSAGKAMVVNFLLSKKAQVALQDSDGKTALHRALENDHQDIYELLFRNYPELRNIPDNKGFKPILDEKKN